MISSVLRSAVRSRALATPRFVAPQMMKLSFPQIRMYSGHHEETFEEFTARYVQTYMEEKRDARDSCLCNQKHHRMSVSSVSLAGTQVKY